MAKPISSPYQELVDAIIPRILSNLDRDPDSPTYGCFDRNYWLLKIHPFASAPLQQAALTLALIYNYKDSKNRYFQKARIKEWIIASLHFWAKIQNKNGGYDEYFKWEGSFPSSAFTAHAVSECCLLFGLKDRKITDALLKTSNFLSKHRESYAVNQETAALCALYNIYIIKKNDRIYLTFKKRLEDLKRSFNEEGWFSEHKGFDAGYHSVTLDYLSILYDKTKDLEIKIICEKMILFLSNFIHYNGSSGGIYCSRNTNFCNLSGLEYFADTNKNAKRIADIKIKHLLEDNSSNFSIDDRYILHFFGHSITRALTLYRERKEKGVNKVLVNKLFKKAGIFIKKDGKSEIYINIKKGGVLMLFNKDKILFKDLGYRINYQGNLYVSELESKVNYNLSDNSIKIRKNFQKIEPIVLTPLKSLFLYLYAFISQGRFWQIMRRKYLTRGAQSRYQLERNISFEKDKIIIKDCILGPEKFILTKPIESIKDIPSSKFFINEEFNSRERRFKIKCNKRASIKTSIDLSINSVITEY